MKISMPVFIGGAAVLLTVGAKWIAPVQPSGEPAITSSRAAAPAGGVEGSIPLDDAMGRVLRCGSGAEAAGGCAGVVYVWSPRMPLSREGIREIRRATERLGIDLAVVEASDLEVLRTALSGRVAASRRAPATDFSPEDALAVEMIAAGATTHFPSLLVHRYGRFAGGAILGYKEADAYQVMVRERLALDSTGVPAPAAGGNALAVGRFTGSSALPAPAVGGEALAGGRFTGSPVMLLATVDWTSLAEDTLAWSKDFPVSGRPGAYFRSVPGRRTLAFEAGETIQLLDLDSGGTTVGPGYIDFVPTPDGRLFVTPQRYRRGLAFYDAAEVFRSAGRGDGQSVEPIYVDRVLRDQYPSVGILASERDGRGNTRTVYRVLTSWYDGIAYRDYEVRADGAGGAPVVQPLADRVAACPRISIPIIGPDGREIAGRDEASATTKIFRITESAQCEEVADLGLQTGKVAWAPDGSRVAFAIPRGAVRDGGGTLWFGGSDPDLAGIFVYDRGSRAVTRVPGSEDAQRLTFPEFVGADSLAFLLSPESRRRGSVFRLVCCLR